MRKSFSIPALSVIIHSDETRKILAPYAKKRKQSKFVRNAIMNYANSRNFEYDATNTRPTYIPKNAWHNITILQKKSYSVDFTYAIAFYWLKSLPEFEYYNKSKLIREIIENTNHHQ